MQNIRVKKILVLGSGALKIGEAGEFDYSGSQALKAFKEEGVETVLVNPNIATVQTDQGLADKIYFLPVTPYFAERVIAREKPDAIALSFGGQTALNCGLALQKNGVLQKYGVRVLGTSVQTIEDTEDRQLFRKKLKASNVEAPKGKAVKTKRQGIAVANLIGYPIFVRLGFQLGGRGSGIARSERQLSSLLERAFKTTSSVLLEEYLEGWKEVEYEMMRDASGNVITICNMENVDPMGIHTGESIVVAPSQTLTNEEYHHLRQICCKVVRSLGIIGECNVQLALSPDSAQYRVIEVNARLSRSSALASKATGYPIAFVAAKIGLGYELAELQNKITKKTSAFFEPALDYVVLKMPRWDLEKFKQVDTEIGPEMKSVGEVMAIGKTFEEALQKAVRMLAKGLHGVVGDEILNGNLEANLQKPNEKRALAAAQAFLEGWSVEKVQKLSHIDPWFLQKIAHIVELYQELREQGLSKERMKQAKRYGFSDWQIGLAVGKQELEIRTTRKQWGITPAVKQIDTMAAEWPAHTNYLYTTYGGETHDIEFAKEKSVIVLGSGTYRIGSSVEFDWCCVNALKTATSMGYKTIIINCNPETVSTDYDVSDRLYFDELSLERVMDIYELEQPTGMIVSMGGQTPNNIAQKCHDLRLRILGTTPKSIDQAENRSKFSSLLDKLNILQPPWKELSSIREAKRFADKTGYPVLLRPSYVLSGEDMVVVYSAPELETYLKKAARVSRDYPVVMSKFYTNAAEIELDAVAQNGKIITSIVSEHIEPAGTHSGDAFIVTPSQKVYARTLREIEDISAKIAAALKILGPFNIQFLAKEQEVRVIETNLRASRSFPFVSKVHNINLAEQATRVILGETLSPSSKTEQTQHVGLKAPQFSFGRLKGADPLPSVDMASTGEVGCLGKDVEEAFLKAAISVGIRPPQKNILVSVGGEEQRYDLLDAVKTLEEMGFLLYGTEHTAQFYKRYGVKMRLLYKVQEEKEPNVETYIKNKKIDFLVSIPREGQNPKSQTAYMMRRLAADFDTPLLTNVRVVRLLVRALKKYPAQDQLEIRPWNEYN